MENELPYSLGDFSDQTKHHPRRRLRLTSLFFTIGLMLMAFNLFIDVTHFFSAAQPHTLGGAITAFAGSILAQITET